MMDDWKLKPPGPAEGPPPPHKDTRRLRWWFFRVPGITGPSDFLTVRSWAGRAGKVCESGLGTATDAQTGWFVVQCRCASIAELRGRLGPDTAKVDRVEEVSHPAHGATLARQMPLIG